MARTVSQVDTRLTAEILKRAEQDAELAARITALEGKAHTHTPPPTTDPTPPPGPWFGLPDPWSGQTFGARPEWGTGQMWISGDQAGKTIGGFTFRNRPAGQNVIVLDGVRNAIVDLIDFDGVPEGIYLNACSDVTIKRLRARNIFGPFTRTGFHSGNLIQASGCSRITISDLKVSQPATAPNATYGTEDIVSLGGAPGTWGNVTVERFAFDGGAWQSWSGTGLFVGDGASGHDVTIRDGILVDPGQVGIGTGEEGPYTFERIDIYQSRGNRSMELRSPRTTLTAVRANLQTGALPSGVTGPTVAPFTAARIAEMKGACAL